MNKEQFDKGMAVRREVAGGKVIDSVMKNAHEFSMPMQELVTEFCGDAIWTRPDLDRPSRSAQRRAWWRAGQFASRGCATS